ncbi:MAG: endonuclease [SAR324 cluster bacterium]|nr:endonuclease [SAR324 cluster bacterium]
MKAYLSLLFSFVLTLAFNLSLQAGGPENFSQGKKSAYKIYQKLYPKGHKSKTFYCNCSYDADKNIDGSCKNLGAEKLNWEHIVPAHALGLVMGVWPVKKVKGKKDRYTTTGKKWVTPEACMIKGGTNKGKAMANRACAEKFSRFNQAEGDLYNLVPAIAKLNKKRSNYPFAAMAQGGELANSCFMEVRGPKGKKKAYVQQKIQGNVARAYLYMDKTYGKNQLLTKEERNKFEAWSKSDPPTEFDCKRAQMIYKITGVKNPYVLCKPADLADLVMN